MRRPMMGGASSITGCSAVGSAVSFGEIAEVPPVAE